ncbi:DUF2007 domain-containing protein [Brucepastera parasyntrophica]|uniref:putative signal transducing protein n=1 Tax=Brucepastera parasyntrophica TaxID=2880008 RepID=UPI0021094CB2|nr:DUF2007 domain-containing protein [Brucepastera parasyntrophica]ULQ60695.1 DUF2007 domain-containing protein [Brucepastera parasyntrophica]
MDQCVFATNKEFEALQVKNIFEENNIDFYIKNLYIQNILGTTKLFTGMDLLAGEIEIFVREEHAEKAANLLSGIFPAGERSRGNEETPALNESREKTGTINSMSGKSFILACLSFLFIPVFFNIGYLKQLFHEKRGIGAGLLFITIIAVSLGILLCAGGNWMVILGMNIFVVPLICVFKGWSLYKKTGSGFSFLLVIPAVLVAFALIFLTVMSLVHR